MAIPQVSYRDRVFDAIEQCSKEISAEDLGWYQSALMKQIDRFIGSSVASKVVVDLAEVKQEPPLAEHQGLLSMLLSKTAPPSANAGVPTERIVVVGDIHCDFTSLVGLLRKLSVSEYDYFARAKFVFLGDYIDRGALPFETLMLLLVLQEILGDRAILLRGNHDEIRFNSDKGTFFSPVTPAETVDLVSQYLKKETIHRISDWFECLPYIVTIERGDRRYLLVHGGIPKESAVPLLSLEALRSTSLPMSETDESTIKFRRGLKTMLWGDPVPTRFKVSNDESRFEFGSEQFETFMKSWSFTHMVRGHEPSKYGFQKMFGDRLFTVFSSGGTRNLNSYYLDSVPYPSFAVIYEDGSIMSEPIFLYMLQTTSPAPRIATQQWMFENDKTAPYGFVVQDAPSLASESKSVAVLPAGLTPGNEFLLHIDAPLFLRESLLASLPAILGRNVPGPLHGDPQEEIGK